MDLQLAGKTVLITGGSKGIGRATAELLAEEGCNLVLVARGPALLEEAAAAIRSQRQVNVRTIPADLSSDAAVRKVAAEAGDIDILVNNAGTIRRADSLEFSEGDWDAVMNTNLKTVFFLSQAVAKRWVAAGRGGKIINVVSMLAFQGGLRVPSYTAAKSGLAGVTKTLCNEWAHLGINVNGLAPGYFATNNTAQLQADETRNRQILERIPAGRWGNPEDLAGAAVFLASRASDYMHGAIVPVDGGWLAR
jgi:2-dehydro-3-deoxy-D-gluconate 5-dehydrogenase